MYDYIPCGEVILHVILSTVGIINKNADYKMLFIVLDQNIMKHPILL